MCKLENGAMESTSKVVQAVYSLSSAIKTLKDLNILRSRRITGDLGEWYVEQLYQGVRSPLQTEKGWDIRLPSSGERLQVKTQTYDPFNKWNYMDSNPEYFDYLVVVILDEEFKLQTLYSVPTSALGSILRTGKESRPSYYWKDLSPWQVSPETLPGYEAIKDLIHSSS